MVSPRIGLLFPGQGSQYVGMGRELFERSEAVRRIYERAAGVLGFDLARLSFSGPQDELRQTRNTQPAILVHSLAVLELLRAEGLTAEAAAGHSVGEYTALVAAGGISLEDGVRLVRQRGELMYQSGLERPGTMAAVMGLPGSEVEEICRRAASAGVVSPANYNAPQQTVISGETAAVELAVSLAREGGARRAQKLEVSGAFHSPLMEPAGEGLRAVLEETSFQRCRFPVLSNVDGKPRCDAEEVRDALARQLTSPVRWVDCVRGLVGRGVGFLLEVGPGRVLAGLARRIGPELQVTGVEDSVSLDRWRQQARAWTMGPARGERS